MEIRRVLEQLHAELAYLNAAIESLEHLRDGRPRGRQVKVLSQTKRTRKGAISPSPESLLPTGSPVSPPATSVSPPASKESD